MCSGRGLCDTLTGDCACYMAPMPGYRSSDGYGNPGNRGDCGAADDHKFYANEDGILGCPGDVACSGHGVCSGSPQFLWYLPCHTFAFAIHTSSVSPIFSPCLTCTLAPTYILSIIQHLLQRLAVGRLL